MKKGLYILLILTFVSLTSFTVRKRLNFSVRLENIDTNSDSLKLEFNIDYPPIKMKPYVNGKIEIFKDDSLFLKLVADSIKIPIALWKFPSIPNEYRIIYPESADSIPYLSKTDNLTFVFSGTGVYYEKWEYKSYYSDKKSRWLFDEKGKQIISIKSEYEPWLFGKDIITIKSNEIFFIENLDIQILDESDKKLEYEIQYKRNPTKKIALKLKEKEKKGKKLKLRIQFDKDKYYEEFILVPDRSVVGIAGKYNDL